MYEVYDIVTFGSVVIIIFFLFVLVLLERNFTKPKIYLRSALLFAMLMIITEEFVSLELYSWVWWFYPFSITMYFLIYPLVYIYSRKLVISNDDNDFRNLLLMLILPAVVLIYMFIIFYPLDYDHKIKFMTLHLSQDTEDFPVFTSYQYIILTAYYLQTIFYMVTTINLFYIVKRNTRSSAWDLMLGKYILLYVFAVVLYEVLIALGSIFSSGDIQQVRVIELLITLIFISLGFYIAFQQSLIIIQSKFTKYADRLDSNESVSSAISNNIPKEDVIPKTLTAEEKIEIRESIVYYFEDSKVYLNPNLKIDQLSKKLHLPIRKISAVINEVFGNNFNQFINEYRIDEAKKKMRNKPDEIVIENLYTKVGFNSRSSFNRVFKEFTDMSPTEYLKSLS